MKKITFLALLIPLVFLSGCATTPSSETSKSDQEKSLDERIERWSSFIMLDLFLDVCESHYNTNPSELAQARKMKEDWLEKNPHIAFTPAEEEAFFNEVMLETDEFDYDSVSEITPEARDMAKKLLSQAIIDEMMSDSGDKVTTKEMCGTPVFSISLLMNYVEKEVKVKEPLI